MLFSSPDYPLFLIAVFFLYALARWGGARLAWARVAVMVLLGDVVFLLVAKDLDTLWDPIGGALLRLAVGEARWPAVVVGHWSVGATAGGSRRTAVRRGSRAASWVCSPRSVRRSRSRGTPARSRR